MASTPEDLRNDSITIVIACSKESPFNRSIWQGFVRGFMRLGFLVQQVDAKHVPDPSAFPERPRLFFVIHGGNTAPEFVMRYRDCGIPTAVYLLDEPYEVDRSTLWARLYDWVFSVDRATVPIHSQHSHSDYLPLGFDEDIFHPDGPRIESDILVLGSCYSVRANLLSPLIKKWGHSVTWVGPRWKQFCPQGTHIDEYISPEQCAQFYRGANIVLNIHRDSYWSHFGDLNRHKIVATHLNPRFWEAAACRSCQLTTPRDDLQVYAPETHTFSTAEELNHQLELFSGDKNARKQNASYIFNQVSTGSYLHRSRHVAQVVGLLPRPGLSTNG